MLLFDILKKDRKNLSTESLTSYKTTLNQLKTHFNIESPTSAEFLFNDFKKLKSYINSFKNTNTRKSKIIGIIVLMSTLKDRNTKQEKIFVKLQNLLSSLNDNYMSDQSTQVKSDKQSKNSITMTQFNGVVNALKKELVDASYKTWSAGDLTKKQFNTLQEYTLVRFYRDHPLRNDVNETKIMPESVYEKLPEKKKDEYNYLLTKDNLPVIFQLNRYKTSKTLGRQAIKINERLGKILKVFIRLTGTDLFLFTKEKDRDESISANDISKILNRVFKRYFPGKNISTSSLRHLQASEFSKENNLPSQEEMDKMEKKINQKFQHSAATNQKIYRKDK